MVVVPVVYVFTLPVIELLTLTSNKNVLYVYVDELDVFDAESKATDLTLAVPIFVFEIDAVEVKLIDEFGTQ